MIVKIPQSFKCDFEKHFSAYHFSIDDLVIKLLETPLISLKHPIVKAKFYIKGVSIRGFCITSETVIIPLYFVTKSSKEGTNLTLDKKTEKMVDGLMGIYTQELNDGQFEIYE